MASRRAHGWRLSGVDMPARLHPAGQTFVEMEDRATPADDDGRRRSVHGVSLLAIGIDQTVELGQEALLGRRFSRRARYMCRHDCPKLLHTRDHVALYHRWPVKTVTALPPMWTRSPSGRTKSTAPRGES